MRYTTWGTKDMVKTVLALWAHDWCPRCWGSTAENGNYCRITRFGASHSPGPGPGPSRQLPITGISAPSTALQKFH